MAERSKESGADVGCGEVREVAGAALAYGPFEEGIRQGVASCADYLGRIGRQLDGVPSRHYVAEKAHALRGAAGRLVGLCHDVEGWLRQCGVEVLHPDGEWYEECVLAAGHGGDHAIEAPRSVLEAARDRADTAALVAVRMAHALGWLAHEPGRLGDPDELEDLGRIYRELRHGVDLVAPVLAALRTTKQDPQERGSVVDADGNGDEAEELVCGECEFQAGGIEHLAGHKREEGH
jgi:hypothetical protein